MPFLFSIKSLSGIISLRCFIFTGFRTADELVHVIAHFYYNAKRPPWVDAAAVTLY